VELVLILGTLALLVGLSTLFGADSRDGNDWEVHRTG
jgi:hypothetical protein